MSKQYGLIIANKSKLTPANEIKKPSIFNDDSGSDEEVEKPTGFGSKLKHQDRVARDKAVEEDPTVFQYDEVYDSIEQKRKDAKLSRKDLDKKPKYISRLLAAAEKRKMDNERRIERQVQKEREAEGDEYKDKESFVTSAYRQKLEEFKKLEEEEKREEYLEAIGDVTRQGNLDGFYRHLYDQKVNYEDTPEGDDPAKKREEKPEPTEDKRSTSESESEKTEESKIVKKNPAQKRKYRKRESSESDDKEENSEEVEKKLEHLPSNLDADSDFSIDSDSDDDEESVLRWKKVKKDAVEEKVEKTEEGAVIAEEKKEDVVVKDEDKEIKEEIDAAVEDKPVKPKIDIWKKRTVGIIFDEALQRYFERKALRDSSGL